jgi:ribulose-phosphate 3-epimerase
MKQSPIIAASILSADFTRLGAEVDAVTAAGAEWIHFDVMDNHFVPNLSIGPLVLESLRKAGHQQFIDVHLMVEPVDALAEAFAKAGANLVSFHPEATRHADRTLNLIKGLGVQVGVVLNPATPLSSIEHLLPQVDLVLLMSVNPGFGGQSYIGYVSDKVHALRQMIDATGKAIRLQVDGGIKANNVGAVWQAGADTFVAGSAIFGAPDYRAVIDAFKQQF